MSRGESDLSESRMSPDEKAHIMQAKRKELSSFFESDVWEFVQNEGQNPERALKARGVLKWSKGDAGLPRAKARLVIRGYTYPDALRGDLKTDSPTATRVGRNCLLLALPISSWKPWTADVATAFLQGKEQDRVLLAQLPADAARLMGVELGPQAGYAATQTNVRPERCTSQVVPRGRGADEEVWARAAQVGQMPAHELCARS